jgi:hypothetical protein
MDGELDNDEALAEQRRRRMEMARTHAFGVNSNMDDLHTQIARLGHAGFSVSTLRAMQRGYGKNPSDKRTILTREIPVLAEACGLPVAFFYVDFAELEEPGLRLEVSRLRADLEELRAQIGELASTRVQQSAEKKRRRSPGRSGGSIEDGP